jgi:hypothetical protein
MQHYSRSSRAGADLRPVFAGRTGGLRAKEVFDNLKALLPDLALEPPEVHSPVPADLESRSPQPNRHDAYKQHT